VVFSLVGHVVILAALMSAHTDLPKAPEPKPITVTLIDESTLALAPAPPAPSAPPAPVTPAPKAQPTPTKPVAQRPMVKPTPHPSPVHAHAHRDIDSILADEAPVAGPDPELSEAQLAGATAAGSGGASGVGGGSGGGACDMAGRLQDVLRKDPLVHVAVARFAGKSMMVWNGDWLWFQGDTGKGLTAVRQAMAWEIAYAPAACRAKPMHGLVVFSLNEGRGSVRLAVGQNDWRWSDLLTTRSAVSEGRSWRQ
jgi:hypothetical protein